jgi:adenylosuccinate synthase
LKKIKICTAYKIDKLVTKEYPADLKLLEQAKPVYETMDGWCCDISGVTRFADLPPNAKKYVKRLEELTGVSISILSVGPDRKSTMVLKPKELF